MKTSRIIIEEDEIYHEALTRTPLSPKALEVFGRNKNIDIPFGILPNLTFAYYERGNFVYFMTTWPFPDRIKFNLWHECDLCDEGVDCNVARFNLAFLKLLVDNNAIIESPDIPNLETEANLTVENICRQDPDTGSYVSVYGYQVNMPVQQNGLPVLVFIHKRDKDASIDAIASSGYVCFMVRELDKSAPVYQTFLPNMDDSHAFCPAPLASSPSSYADWVGKFNETQASGVKNDDLGSLYREHPLINDMGRNTIRIEENPSCLCGFSHRSMLFTLSAMLPSMSNSWDDIPLMPIENVAVKATGTEPVVMTLGNIGPMLQSFLG